MIIYYADQNDVSYGTCWSHDVATPKVYNHNKLIIKLIIKYLTLFLVEGGIDPSYIISLNM